MFCIGIVEHLDSCEECQCESKHPKSLNLLFIPWYIYVPDAIMFDLSRLCLLNMMQPRYQCILSSFAQVSQHAVLDCKGDIQTVAAIRPIVNLWGSHSSLVSLMPLQKDDQEWWTIQLCIFILPKSTLASESTWLNFWIFLNSVGSVVSIWCIMFVGSSWQETTQSVTEQHQ